MRVAPLVLILLLPWLRVVAAETASPLDVACTSNAKPEEATSDFAPLHALRFAVVLGQVTSRSMTLAAKNDDHNQLPAERILPDKTSQTLALAEPVDLDSFALTTLRLLGTPAHLAGQPAPTQEHAAELNREWGIDQLDLAQISDGGNDTKVSRISIIVPPEASTYGPFWPMTFNTFAVVACPKGGSGLSARAYIMTHDVSDYIWAALDTAVLVILIWIGAAAAVQSASRRRGRVVAPHPTDGHNFMHWLRSLDPVIITQDGLGFGSTSRLQVFFFTIVLVATLTYVFLRAGYLAEIPSDILPLLGIGAASGVLSHVISNARAGGQDDITFRTDRWLSRHGIVFPPRTARWHDLLVTGQEFDVYKFQGIIFSGLVGFWILSSGLSNLNALTIPHNIMLLLGLSQIVFIGGKTVGSNRDGRRELNLAVNQAMCSEHALWKLIPSDHPFRREAQLRGLSFVLGQVPPTPLVQCPEIAESACTKFQRDAVAAAGLASQVLGARNTSQIQPVDPPDDTASASFSNELLSGLLPPQKEC